MNTPQRIYEKIYQILRSNGIDALEDFIKQRGIDEYVLNAIRTLASLPDPRVATRREAAEIARECISGYLEFCFQTENIGKMAKQLLELLEKEPDQLIDVPLGALPNRKGVSDSEYLLRSNNNMLLNLTTAVRKLSVAVDIDLKGQCPHCQGPLVEVLEYTTSGGDRELRLRCKRQSTPACRKSDWFLQDVQERKP